MLNSKRLEKIRREIKRPFKDYTNTTNKIKALQACKSEIDAFWGESNEINKGIETVLRFYRWSAILGRSLARFVGVPDPFPNPKHPCNNFWLFARQVGIDLKKEIHATDGALILDGIKIPLPRNKSEKMMLEYELHDILFPSYLKRKYESFDRYCETIGGLLNDFPEGPYEFGKVCLKEGNIVFDCGANVGVFSAVASRYGCQSFAFEAIPDIIDDYLSKTATMNGNIHVHNVAVWDKEEILNFTVMQDISASRCDQLIEQADCKKINKQVTVPAMPLDIFVEMPKI